MLSTIADNGVYHTAHIIKFWQSRTARSRNRRSRDPRGARPDQPGQQRGARLAGPVRDGDDDGKRHRHRGGDRARQPADHRQDRNDQRTARRASSSARSRSTRWSSACSPNRSPRTRRRAWPCSAAAVSVATGRRRSGTRSPRRSSPPCRWRPSRTRSSAGRRGTRSADPQEDFVHLHDPRPQDQGPAHRQEQEQEVHPGEADADADPDADPPLQGAPPLQLRPHAAREPRRPRRPSASPPTASPSATPTDTTTATPDRDRHSDEHGDDPARPGGNTATANGVQAGLRSAECSRCCPARCCGPPCRGDVAGAGRARQNSLRRQQSPAGAAVRYRVPAFLGAGVAASALAALLGYLQKTPCSSGGAWNTFTSQFRDSCYTDIYPLYYVEKLSDGKVPYYGHPVEYPVLMGWMMQAAAWMVHAVGDPLLPRPGLLRRVGAAARRVPDGRGLATAATAYREGDEPGWKAALLTALSPGLILAAYINWDLFAMALTAGGMAAWAGERAGRPGALLGLAVATKFYPLLMFAALLLLCLRAGKLREFAEALAGAVIAWLVINVPVALTATSGWAEFYAFSRSRGADWGSMWFMFQNYKVPVLGNSSLGQLNLIAAFAVACVLIAALDAWQPHHPPPRRIRPDGEDLRLRSGRTARRAHPGNRRIAAQLRRQLRHPRHFEVDRGHHRAAAAARALRRGARQPHPDADRGAVQPGHGHRQDAHRRRQGDRHRARQAHQRRHRGDRHARSKACRDRRRPHRRHRQGTGHARDRGCRHARRPHRPARGASGRARRSGDGKAGDAHPRRRRPAQRPARGAFHLDPHQLRGCRADARPAYRQDDGNAGQEHGGERRGNGGAQPQRRRGDRLAQSKRGRAERHHRQERCRRQ